MKEGYKSSKKSGITKVTKKTNALSKPIARSAGESTPAKTTTPAPAATPAATPASNRQSANLSDKNAAAAGPTLPPVSMVFCLA